MFRDEDLGIVDVKASACLYNLSGLVPFHRSVMLKHVTIFQWTTKWSINHPKHLRYNGLWFWMLGVRLTDCCLSFSHSWCQINSKEMEQRYKCLKIKKCQMTCDSGLFNVVITNAVLDLSLHLNFCVLTISLLLLFAVMTPLCTFWLIS